MSVVFEILITSEPIKHEACLRNIRKEFKSRPKPLFDKKTAAETKLDGFYRLKLRIKTSEAWQVAERIMAIDGVEDVDPEVEQVDELIDMESDQQELEAPLRADMPPPNWIHKNSRFKEAISYAIQQAKNGEGAYKGGHAGIRIAQLDTGYTHHPEIATIRKELGWNYVYTWWDRLLSWLYNRKHAKRVALDRLKSFRPFTWPAHGTATAAIIIGKPTSNMEITSELKDRTDGVFPEVDLIPYRISKTVVSFNNKVAHAALQAISDGCKVITMSHAGILMKRSWKEAAAAAYEAGVIWVAATGSHLKNIKTVWLYPAKFPEVITAAASKYDDTVWEKSFMGNKVEISAPGYQIYVPYAAKGRKFQYRWSEGTSFSTPMVAAAAALWLAHHSEEKLEKEYAHGWQKVEAFRYCLKESANTPTSWNKELHGEGLLDAYKLITIPLPDPELLIHATKGITMPAPDSNEKRKRYICDKEICYLTAKAKIEMKDDRKGDTYDYVKKKASPTTTARIKEVVEVNDGDNSTLLKAHVKKYAEGMNY